MANETTSLFGSLPESQTNDGKIILHTDNGAESQGLHYDSVFYNCGIDTETGRAELAEIPSDWKE